MFRNPQELIAIETRNCPTQMKAVRRSARVGVNEEEKVVDKEDLKQIPPKMSDQIEILKGYIEKLEDKIMTIEGSEREFAKRESTQATDNCLLFNGMKFVSQENDELRKLVKIL